MTRLHTTLGGIAIIAAGAFVGLAGGSAQPETPPPPPRAIDRTPEQVRAMLTWQLRETDNRIARYQARRVRLKQALQRLDDGAVPSEILDEMRPARNGPPMDADQRRDELRRPDQGRPGEAPHDRIEIPHDRLMAALDEHLPELAKQLRTLRTDDPAKFNELVGRLGPRFAEVLELRKSDPALARLKFKDMRTNLAIAESARAFRQLRETSDDAQAIQQARAALRKALEASFESRLAIRKQEIERLGDRIESYNADLLKQIEHKDELIDQQLQRIERSERFMVPRRATPPRGRRPRDDDGQR